MKPKIIFFGNERLATGLPESPSVVLARLIERGYEIEAVVLRPVDTRKKADGLTVQELANRNDIPVITPETKEQLANQLGSYQADLGVLVAFGLIIPQSVIDRFKHGILNIHPSLLPLYRGSTPIEQVILKGDTETGVSVMGITQKMDAGPVYAQEKLALRGDESKQGLAGELLLRGTNLLEDQIGRIAAGTAAPKPQIEADATYSDRITKADGLIDWNKPARDIEREVRAYAGWPGSQTKLMDREVTITVSHVAVGSEKPGSKNDPGAVSTHDNVLAVACGDGEWLVVDRIKPAGKKDMPAADFLRGLR